MSFDDLTSFKEVCLRSQRWNHCENAVACMHVMHGFKLFVHTHRAASTTAPNPLINTMYARIYVLHGVHFSLSLFVNGNGGAPKGRWSGNKWRIFSLLNRALEGLWLGVVGYKTQQFGCTHVLVHWLMGWQLCCLGVVLGHASGHALHCSFGTGAFSGPTGDRFRERPSPTWRPAPLHQSEWYKTVSRRGM